MAAMHVDASTGVMNTLLPKLSKLLEEYTNIKGAARNQITFLRDELSSMKPVLEMFADVDDGLDPLKREWRDNVRELAFDIEDYTDSFMIRVSHESDELPTGFKGFFRKLKKLKACPEIADAIDELIKKCAMEGSKRHKRYFIVIDDVRDAEAWKAIELALFNNTCGSRIVITTRNSAVASCCSHDGGYVYQMEPLSLKNSKMLFFKRAFGSEDLPNPQLEKVSDGILQKCGGLPLAIMIMSSLLADQNEEDEWKRVLTAIGSVLAKDPDDDIMKSILSLSYYDLPHHLRACLLYLSIFPEDYEINKQRLINRWIAEGFILEEQGLTSYEVGERYFNYLINRCLIQPVGSKHGQAKACQVHGIILDFLACKASEENFVTPFNDDAEQGLVSENKVRVRRLHVNNHNKKEVARLTGPVLSHVRSLTLFGDFGRIPMSAFTALRVMDQEDNWDLGGNWGLGSNHHMAHIEMMLHLRYLRLNSPLLDFVLTARTGGLENLETLDLLGVSVVELPSAITRLRRLARLYISHLARFPKGTIAKLQSLEELSEFGFVSFHQQWECLQEFSQLTKLRMLKVKWDFDWSFVQDEEGLQSYMHALISSCNVHNLYIGNIHIWPGPYPLSLESCCPTTTCSLQKLHITYCFICKVPNWMSSLGNLKELKLYIYCLRAEDVKILGAIPTLIFLKLKTFYGTDGRIFIPGYKGFRCLKYFGLVMISCGTTPEFEEGSMPNLEHLKLRFCVHEMECINGATDFGIRHLSTLNKVEVHIYGCSVSHKDYDPEADREDSNAKNAAFLIKAAVKALPNRVTCSFELAKTYGNIGTFHGLIKILNRHNGISVERLLQEMLKSRVKQMIQNNMVRARGLF